VNWEYYNRRRLRSVRKTRYAKPTVENGYVFSNAWWRSYYHFVIDSCLKAIDLGSAGALDRDTVLIYHSRPNRWQSEYLDLLGLAGNPLMVLDAGCVKVSRLLIAAPRRSRYACSQEAIQALRRRVFERLEIDGTGGGRKIYISRRFADTRNLLNEAEVRSLVESRGFESFVLEDMSVADQIRLFAEAETIVAPHGAGLTNMIYADRPCIIELMPTDRWNLGHFVALANSIGAEHIPVVSAPVRGVDDPRLTGAMAMQSRKNFRAELERLDAVLSSPWL
jgi:capsular polysaccharide biosynthesis protein